ncbi:MAG TPA: hypothetical protein VK953_00360 [Methylophilus sp.]|nr:hypothetical protein [Methylophilus sp.]
MVLLAAPPTDSETQKALKYLGKAIYIACKFEEYCQHLVFVLEVRRPRVDIPSDEESFKALVKLVNSKLINLNKFISDQAKLREDATTLLYSARESRNYIVHEALRDFELQIQKHDGFSQWQKKLTDELNSISLGIAIVAVLLSRHTAEPKITDSEFESYPNIVELWVFDRD